MALQGQTRTVGETTTRTVKTGRWFGDPDRPLMGWLHTPEGVVTGSGVLVLPDIGAQYWSSHWTLRVLSEQLAERGHTVLRIDYDGTGDAAGCQWDPKRVDAWRASASRAAAELRSLGCEHLTVFGVRFGGLLALLGDHGADEVIAWEPATSGRRFARELRLIGEALPEDEGVVSSGVVFTQETLDALAKFDVTKSELHLPARTLVIGELPARAAQSLERATTVDYATPSSDVALARPTMEAEVADEVVEAVLQWIDPPLPAVVPAPEPRAAARFSWDGTEIEERATEVTGLVGVLSEPVAVRPDATTLVLLNPGSESHVGPGRAWVEYARAAAAAGHRALRVDWRGWGESPDDGYGPGRPYDEHTHAETVQLVEALRAAGHERVVLLGLCASGWIAMRVAREAPVAGVVSINPQLYWQPGDPVLSQEDTEAWFAPQAERFQKLNRWKLWSALDAVGVRPPVARWLEQLTRRRVPALVLFSDGDAGLGFLRARLGRRVERLVRRGFLRVEEVEQIDHGMHRAWLRPKVEEVLVSELDRVSRMAA